MVEEISVPEECMIKMVEGEEICVQKYRQTFNIKGLGNQFVYFIFNLDVSDSMLDDLYRVGQGFKSLISHIDSAHWSMFFTTADHGDHQWHENPQTGQKVFTHQKWEDHHSIKTPHFGQFMFLERDHKLLPIKKLDKTVPQYAQVFLDTLARTDGCLLPPFCQGDHEQPLRALNASLGRLARQPSWLAHPGDIIAFLITDEDERVEDPKSATTAEEVVQNFQKLFPDRNLYAFTMVIKDTACYKKQTKNGTYTAHYGTKVARLADLTGGQSVSICEENYDAVFQDISKKLKQILVGKLTLKKPPILPDSIEVTFVKGKPVPWHIKGSHLIFSAPLEPGSQIVVEYLTYLSQVETGYDR